MSPARTVILLVALCPVGAALSARISQAAHGPRSKPANPGSRLSSDITGDLPARPGERLSLSTGLGNLIIHTQNSGKVTYHVHLEADSAQKNARQLLENFAFHAHRAPDGVHLHGRAVQDAGGRLWVTIEVNIPRAFQAEASTGGGNIQLDDISGRVELSTDGGNISAGNIDGSARLDTKGGHISVKDVSGNLISDTGGGHITAGAIGGSASLQTSGGHIRASSIAGSAHLFTGGGNVTLEHSGGELSAETSGGQIDVGEVSGLVRAKTGGGGIRVVRMSGPSDLHTVGGNIYLTQVDSAVTASAAAGGITAWFVMPSKHAGNCELDSNDGDIVVYLPRELPATIDAQVQMADEHRVIVDPAFPIKLSYDDSSNGMKTVRAEGALNGGGEVLRLRAVEGNIRLVLSDAGMQSRHYKQQMDLLQQQMRELQLQLRGLLADR